MQIKITIGQKIIEITEEGNPVLIQKSANGKKCPICGDDIRGRQKNRRRFCSDKCRRRFYNRPE